MSDRRDDLAYGDDPGRDRGNQSQGADRGIIGDTFKFLKNKYQQSQQPSQSYGYTEQPYSSSNQPSSPPQAGYNPNPGNQLPYPGGPPPQPPQPKPDTVGSILNTLHGVVHGVGTDIAGKLGTSYEPYSSSHQGAQGGQASSQTGYSASGASRNRFDSFAAQKNGNDAKWYVDGCGYMYAVSKALESARESIWILDWWLSPELYLRRPPMKNEPYRIDRMLQAAAQRGVRVNIIVYKEVTQALTRKYLSPTLPSYLHSLLPRSTDAVTSLLVKMGLMATAASMEYLEAENPLIAPPITVSSSHTKHALEDLHPNIAVFRHPDHLPDAQTIQSSLISSLSNLKLDAATASQMGSDALKAVYGITDGVILYWAHHEKLCLIDSKIAFMGGLDLCYGRWDTNQHAIADAHPHDLNAIIFPGQDYNNARIMDFDDVVHWQNNKLDRKNSSRMGWSDISVSLHGPVVQDLRQHFMDRWNFILDEKYTVRRDVRYSRLPLTGPAGGIPSPPSSSQQGTSHQQQNNQPSAYTGYGSQPAFPPPPTSSSSNYVPYQQSTSRPHTPQPFQVPQESQQQTLYGGQQQGQYYPPPPPGPPPSTQHGAGTSGSETAYNGPLPGHNYPTELEASTGPGTYSVPQQAGQNYPPPPTQQTRGFGGEESFDEPYEGARAQGGKPYRYEDEGRQLKDEVKGIGSMLYGRAGHHLHQAHGKLAGGTEQYGQRPTKPGGAISCQIVRSCAKWSNGTATEHSIQNAYIDVIRRSQHFVYIENQFFITATGDLQKPVKNQVGQAIVERILRAAQAGERYKVFVLMPSVPAFAGDLRDDAALGTRAIMEFQYKSINRGGHSIMEMIAQKGVNPMEYIRFYNLRNYDRINAGGVMQQAEDRSGVNYEDARRQHDDAVGAGYGGWGEGTGGATLNPGSQYQQYQQAAQQVSQGKQTGSGRWDTVSECYMLGGEDIRNVPWDGTGGLSEIDAFVSEELYIHSKARNFLLKGEVSADNCQVLIADDRVVICGSANMNDRSQLGTHDSEIAIIIEDPTPLQSMMAGRPWQANRFAASLRRQLVRKHLGLIPPQDVERPDENFEPVGIANKYDWGTPEDNIVADPLSDTFQSLWNTRAKTNTEVFRKVFHAVPDDTVRNWNTYKEFYEYYFHKGDVAGKESKESKESQQSARYLWGHVVRDNFSPGAEGVREVKDLLSRVKGTLVEMPLMFLIEEDIAKEGATLNALTEEIYT